LHIKHKIFEHIFWPYDPNRDGLFKIRPLQNSKFKQYIPSKRARASL